MTKITVDPTDGGDDEPPKPSTKKLVEVEDTLGRKLKIRKLNALMKADLAMMLGPEGTRNEEVRASYLMAFTVTEIDGEQVLTPNSYAELRQLLGRLDDEGIIAAGQAQIDHFGATIAPEASAVKNS